MIFASIFGLDQNIIKVNNDKNVNFFYSDFFDIALKLGKSVKKSKKYKLILKIAILHLKNSFSFFTFSYSYFIISIY